VIRRLTRDSSVRDGVPDANFAAGANGYEVTSRTAPGHYMETKQVSRARFAYNCLLARAHGRARGPVYTDLQRGWDVHSNAVPNLPKLWPGPRIALRTRWSRLRRRGLLDDTLCLGGEFDGPYTPGAAFPKENYGRHSSDIPSRLVDCVKPGPPLGHAPRQQGSCTQTCPGCLASSPYKCPGAVGSSHHLR